jgi:hypothetical protein
MAQPPQQMVTARVLWEVMTDIGAVTTPRAWRRTILSSIA